MKITSYKKDGKTFYKFNIYLGRDEFGKEIRTNRQGFETKKDAQIEYLRLKENGTDASTEAVTLDSAYKQWLESYKLTVRPSTYERTTSLYRLHVQPEFGDRLINKISTSDIQKYVNDKSQVHSKYGEMKSLINRIYNFAIVNKMIDFNPCAGVILPRATRTEPQEENFYEAHELKEFLYCAENDLPFLRFVYLRLLAFTGMRRAEALALLKTDVDINRSQININKTLSRGTEGSKLVSDTKTFQGNRIIDIDHKTMELLRELMASNDYDILFPDSNGNYLHLSTPIKWLNKVIETNKLKKITLHGLRHTHCSLLFEAGAGIKEVQHRLGHKDVATTMNIYAHVTKNKKMDTVNKFVDLLK